MSDIYAFNEIEPRWQRHWEDHKLFRAANPGEPASERPKFYVLDFFPYPSGAGLHVGHPLGYIASDVIARYRRMRGCNVLHPMGWDAFGLPAEQYAIETGVHPRITTQKNIAMYKRQLRMIGLGYDWDREFATCDPDYYRWTQWIFLQIYNSWYDPEHRWTDAAGRAVVGGARPIDQLPIPPEVRERGDAAVETYQDEHRLAYVAEVPVNWCPALGTVLSNEEVTNEGRSDRGNHPVYRRPLRQWMLRITEYAERLLADLEPLDWPESIKLMQRNWIGRSEGAYTDFALEGRHDDIIRVFTTRPDTLFGATYIVLAPEHRLVPIITTPARRADVDAYVSAAQQKSELDRTAETKAKTGVFTGAYAINPVNRARVPIWVADYVLISYGTGSIMAVPAHDTRDYEFSKTFDLPIIDVIYPPVVFAMRYFTEHAPEPVRADDVWTDALARFLDRVVAADAQPEHFAQELAATLKEKSKKTAANLCADAALKQLPPAVEQQRGNSNVTWAQAFEALGFRRFAELAESFRTAQFYAQTGEAFVGDGYNVNSPITQTFPDQGDLNGLCTPDAKHSITQWLQKRDLGEGTVQYKLRDWLFSRQRYWGEPFPILYREDGRALAEQEGNLPVTLPEMEDYRPIASDDPDAEPQTPLSRAPADWIQITRNGQTLRRELNTMPQWAGSCWYYLRFLDARNENALVGPEVEKYWMGGTQPDGTPKLGGVDLYMGGAEHAVLHLLYARFWHKVMYDLGHVSTPEPFDKLFNQGMLTAYAYRDARGVYVPYDDIDFREDVAYHKQSGEKLIESVEKMSKTLKNVVNPDQIIHDYGADTLRLYEMYMGPLEASKPWNPRDIVGPHRFLQRLWRLVVVPASEPEAQARASGRTASEPVTPATDRTNDAWRLNPRIVDRRNDQLERLLHKTIRKVQLDIERFAMNTAIAQMIVWCNEAQRADQIGRDQIERFLRVLSPFAPHICEELWQRLGHDRSITLEPWPEYDQALTIDKTIEMAVQVNGKLRGRITVPTDASDEQIVAAARQLDAVAKEVADRTVKRTIIARRRLVNLVV
jgi:leucyl-tRNA synthetase